MKDKVYAHAPQSIQELKDKIHAVIYEIESQMCENVMENFIKKVCTEETVSLNQRNISLIYGQRKNFFELKKVLLIKKNFFDSKK